MAPPLSLEEGLAEPPSVDEELLELELYEESVRSDACPFEALYQRRLLEVRS